MIGLVVLIFFPDGHENVLWTCLAGFLLGFPGLAVMLRHDANRRRRLAADAAGPPTRPDQDHFAGRSNRRPVAGSVTTGGSCAAAEGRLAHMEDPDRPGTATVAGTVDGGRAT